MTSHSLQTDEYNTGYASCRNEMLCEAVEVLNEALRADPVAMRRAIFHRIECNDKLGDHPTIQCGVRKRTDANYPPGTEFTKSEWAEKVTTVGALGLINGLFGVHPAGHGFICVVVDDDKAGTILRFELTDAITMQDVESSNLKQVGHNGVDELHVIFKSGSRYAYKGVTAETFQDLLAAESVGSFLASNIKSVYEGKLL